MRRGVVLVLAAVLAAAVRAQGYLLLSPDNGLSSTLINSLYQDRSGMLWICTENGLNRWDGVKITTYRHRQGDDTSLAHNHVNFVFQDSKGHMLVGTMAGLQVLDPAADTFAHVQYDSGGMGNVALAIERKDGTVLAAGNNLFRIDFAEDGARARLMELLPNPAITAGMIEDRHGTLWLSRNDGRIYSITRAGEPVPHAPDQRGGEPGALTEDREGFIYCTSPDRGFTALDTDGLFRDPDGGASLSMKIKHLCPASADEMYVATDGDGIMVYNNKTRRLSPYGRLDSNTLTPHSKVHHILKDREGNLWVAVFQKGVLMIPPQTSRFKYWGHKSVTHNVIGEFSVSSLMVDNLNRAYVGTDNDGLYVVGDDGTLLAHHTHTADPASVPATVTAIYRDSGGTVWVGGYGGGAATLDPATGRCRYLPELAAANVFAFTQDGRGQLWVATMGRGLFYRSHDGIVHHISEHNPDQTPMWTGYIAYSPSRNVMYAGSYEGLYCIDIARPDMPIERIKDSLVCHTLLETDQGRTLWAGTSDGLLRYDVQSRQLTWFTMAHGLPDDVVYAILPSRTSDDLWISTAGGLTKFSPSRLTFDNYYADDGLQSNEFGKNAACADSRGRLWFGGVGGVTYFRPSEITTTHRKWTVRLTDFYLNRQPVRRGTLSGGRQIIDRAVHQAEDFYLGSQDNSFAVELSTEQLGNTSRVTYAYSLDGAPWIEVMHGTNLIPFANLTPGRHRISFRVTDGHVESEPRTIFVHIAPPLWATWWAWCLYCLAALALAAGLVMHLRQRRAISRERERNERDAEISEAKLQFFINISHEIRTPMTLITSPLAQLRRNDPDPKRQRTYATIERNAERILQLINQLMDIRKIEKGKMRMDFSPTDIVEMTADVVRTFTPEMEKKGVALAFNHNVDTLELWADTRSLDKILMNLLSNACKFTPAGGRIDVALTADQDAATATLTVADTGRGIPPDELERIFDRFYQAKGVSHYQGTGVGLHLTRSLVQLHHGSISAAARPDGHSGAVFTLVLPLGKDHLSEEELAPPQPVQHRQPDDDSAPQPHPDDEPDSARARLRCRILVVEDDEEIRRYISDELADDHYVSGCTNGREALDMMFKKAPDLVISDVMMPEMDGLSLCRKMKQNIHLNHIPVVLLTARTRDEDTVEGLQSGADAYITKPFNIEVLRHTVRNLIHSRRQLRNIYAGSQNVETEDVPTADMQTPDERLMDRVMKTINANLANPALTVTMIADEVGISRGHLHRKLKELTNQKPQELIRNVRMKQAASVLAQKRFPIYDVALMVGYDNASSFSAAFKEVHGITPSSYQEQHLPTPS